MPQLITQKRLHTKSVKQEPSPYKHIRSVNEPAHDRVPSDVRSPLSSTKLETSTEMCLIIRDRKEMFHLLGVAEMENADYSFI